MFDGNLGTWNGKPYDIKLKPDAEPYHGKPFPIPRIHEITFLIPKKDSTVRFISDFREMNKRILRQPYPIPKIQDLLLRHEEFRYGTTLDLNMGYYHIELSAK